MAETSTKALAVGIFGHADSWRCYLAQAATSQSKGVGNGSPVATQTGGFTNLRKRSFCLTAVTCVAA